MLILLLAISCSRAYFPLQDEDDIQICLSARLNTADTLHRVLAAGAAMNRVVGMPGGHLSVRIGDGEPRAVLVGSDQYAVFSARILPSDTVRLGYGKAKVSVRGQAVPQAEILGGWYSRKDSLSQATVRIGRDPQGENFYLVQLVVRDDAWRDNDGKRVLAESRLLELDVSDSPLQQMPRMLVVEGDDFGEDGFCTLTIRGTSIFFAGLPHEISSPYIRYEGGKMILEPEAYTRILQVSARISTLDREDYWTLKYLSDESWAGLLPGSAVNELYTFTGIVPKVFPENVEDGIGLVTVRSAVELPLATVECHYDHRNYTSPETVVTRMAAGPGR